MIEREGRNDDESEKTDLEETDEAIKRSVEQFKKKLEEDPEFIKRWEKFIQEEGK